MTLVGAMKLSDAIILVGDNRISSGDEISRYDLAEKVASGKNNSWNIQVNGKSIGSTTSDSAIYRDI